MLSDGGGRWQRPRACLRSRLRHRRRGGDPPSASESRSGRTVSGLQVDSQNVTGVLGLYESLGFTKRRTQVSWTLAPPSPAPQ
jgi:ribosomal protein S18 acetylase RimI-like enzyme